VVSFLEVSLIKTSAATMCVNLYMFRQNYALFQGYLINHKIRLWHF
jgi:hypothetical protein